MLRSFSLVPEFSGSLMLLVLSLLLLVSLLLHVSLLLCISSVVYLCCCVSLLLCISAVTVRRFCLLAGCDLVIEGTLLLLLTLLM
jgi:hypothetical protein